MKPKILAVKFFDYVILAILAIILLVVAFKAFFAQDSGITELRDEMGRLVRVVETNMRDTTPRPVEVADYSSELVRRFKRLPVLSAYSVNPFRPREVIPGDTILLVKGQSKTLRFEGVRITDDLSTQAGNVEITMEHDSDKDVSVVKIVAKERGTAHVKLRDFLDTVYLYTVSVRESETLTPPRAPVACTVIPFPPEERVDGKRVAPKVLIAFIPDNPNPFAPDAGEYSESNRAVIYRKHFGAPDMDYVRITPRDMLSPLTSEQAKVFQNEFLRRPEQAGGPGAMPDLDRPGAAVRPQQPARRDADVPMKLDDYMRRAAPARPDMGGRDMAQYDVSLEALLAAKNFAFVDNSVDEGESYVYKIVTVAYSPPTREECKDPYITPLPVDIAALVEFTVASVSKTGAAFNVTRNVADAAFGADRFQTFRADNGMLIGGIVQVKDAAEALDRSRAPRYNVMRVDFSTGCALVSGMTGMRTVEYKVQFNRRTNKYQYRVSLKTDPRALYLTPGGVLRWKGREKTERAPAEMGERALPGRGGPERPPAVMDERGRGAPVGPGPRR